MKVIIEKELCNPVNGEIVGPLYHVYKVVEETGKKELVQIFRGNIQDAARMAERTMDFEKLELDYKRNPESFFSCRAPKEMVQVLPGNPQTGPVSVSIHAGTVTNVKDGEYIEVDNSFHIWPEENYGVGDEIAVIVFKSPKKK